MYSDGKCALPSETLMLGLEVTFSLGSGVITSERRFLQLEKGLAGRSPPAVPKTVNYATHYVFHHYWALV